MLHSHKWNPESGDCDAILQVGGRMVACAARRCAAPGCQEKRQPPPIDYCRAHLYLSRRLVLPSKSRHA